MSVSASFIEGLLSTSEGDSNGSGDGLPDTASGGGEEIGDAGASLAAGQQGQNPGGIGNPEKGAEPAVLSSASAEPGKETAEPVVEAPKGPDEPTVQIGKLNGALREVRGENKELKQQLSTYSAQLTALQEQIKALANPPAKVEPEEEPDFLADPRVWAEKTAAKTAAALKKLEDAQAEQAKRDTEAGEQSKKQAEMQEQWGEVLTHEAEFSAATPDYQQALGFIRNLRSNAFAAEFEANNDRAPTQAEVSKALTAQEIQGALLLQQKGKNPAQWYYDYAKKLGYKTPEPEAETVAEPAAVAAAVAAAAKATAKPAPAKPDKEAVKSMGSGGGSGTPADPEEANKDPMAAMLAGVHGEMTAKRKARRG